MCWSAHSTQYYVVGLQFLLRVAVWFLCRTQNTPVQFMYLHLLCWGYLATTTRSAPLPVVCQADSSASVLCVCVCACFGCDPVYLGMCSSGGEKKYTEHNTGPTRSAITAIQNTVVLEHSTYCIHHTTMTDMEMPTVLVHKKRP